MVFAAVPVATREVVDGGLLSRVAAAISLDRPERPFNLSPLALSVEP